jgi:von Willebrand factor type A domain/Aerotolerance regulator N-terminal
MAARPSRFLTTLSLVWFPVTLALLLLLAVPGGILLLLNVLGWETPINKWLQERYHLSYHIPVPSWAALLLLLVPLLLVLLYFLKLKRKPLQVPSTFLWRKSIEDLHVNSLFQWLRNNVLLLLQVLTVLFLIYAVMALQVHGATTEGIHYILMLDNSASMSATDVAPNRLEQAKEQAAREIDGHSDQDFGMVIVFNSTAEILQSYTSDRNKLREAVAAIHPTQRPTRIEEALGLAASLANPTRSTDDVASRPAAEEPGKERTYVAPEGIPTEVHLFSDGRFPDVPEFSQGNLDLRLHVIGEPGADKVNNVGIVTFNAIRDEIDRSRIQVLVNVHNYRPAPVPVRVRLEVTIGDDMSVFDKVAQPLGVRVEVPEQATISGRSVQPGQEKGTVDDRPGEGTAVFELKDVDDRGPVFLHAFLPEIQDHFALDNEAWLVLGMIRKARVLIVGPPNKVLAAFFEHDATRRVAKVAYLDRADLKDEEKYRRPARIGDYDLVIFDRCAPEKEEDLPLANTFFIDALPPPWKKPDKNELQNPHIKGWLRSDPLMRNLAALYDVGVSEAFAFELDPDKNPGVPPRTPRLLETDKNVAIMFSLSRQSFTDVVQTFAFLNDNGEWVTNWPLHPSFPLFLRNVLYVLGNVRDTAGEETIQPGQVKTLRPDVAVQEVEVVEPAADGRPDPQGTAKKLVQSGSRVDFTFGDAERTGIYLVKWGDQVQRAFSVNLLDSDESNIEPRKGEEVRVGSSTLATGATRSQARETWQWVALAALLLLLVEWVIYNRRIFV